MKSNKIEENEIPIFVISLGVPILLSFILSLIIFGKSIDAMIILLAIGALVGLFINKILKKQEIKVGVNKIYVVLLFIILIILMIFIILSRAIWLFR